MGRLRPLEDGQYYIRRKVAELRGSLEVATMPNGHRLNLCRAHRKKLIASVKRTRDEIEHGAIALGRRTGRRRQLQPRLVTIPACRRRDHYGGEDAVRAFASVCCNEFTKVDSHLDGVGADRYPEVQRIELVL